jgi:hypothetical protein
MKFGNQQPSVFIVCKYNFISVLFIEYPKIFVYVLINFYLGKIIYFIWQKNKLLAISGISGDNSTCNFLTLLKNWYNYGVLTGNINII